MHGIRVPYLAAASALIGDRPACSMGRQAQAAGLRRSAQETQPMPPTEPLRTAPMARRCRSDERLLWITPERVFYVGLLGAPTVRTMGAITVYAALEGALRLRIAGGPWQSAELALVPPYAAHEVACEARHIMVLQVEPETVDPAGLPALLRAPAGALQAPDFAAHLRHCHARLVGAGRAQDPAPNLAPAAFDTLLFGRPLPPRRLDPRIAGALARLGRDPAAPLPAQEHAARAGLSFSRFLHLFKAQTGAPWRSLRSWKRARSLLHHVQRETNLAHLALEVGYPDSTHFSHSIRQVYGLKPRDIFAGSRKLRLIERAPA